MKKKELKRQLACANRECDGYKTRLEALHRSLYRSLVETLRGRQEINRLNRVHRLDREVIEELKRKVNV